MSKITTPTGIDWDEGRNRAEAIRLGRKLDRYAERILQDSSSEAQGLMKGYTPVDTGLLQGKVTVEFARDRIGPMLLCGVRGVPYAPYVEFGTSRTRPQPFLRPMIGQMAPRIRQRARAKKV